MPHPDWMRLIKSGESLTVELKRQVPKLDRLARTVSAFSNSSGGTIFFGVDDDGGIVGLESPEGTRELIEQVCFFHCQPRVDPEIHDWSELGRDLIVVEVPESDEKPIYAVNPNKPKDAWPYFRSNKENLPLDKKSLKTMGKSTSIELDDRELAKLDRHAVNMMNHLDRKPRQTVNQLAKSANISPHRAKKIIVQLEKNGWIHCFFNEKRREYSLVVPWRKG